MFFRNLKLKPDVVLDVAPAHVMLPIRLGRADADAAFAKPFANQLAAASLGVLTEARARVTNSGEPDGLDLFLGLRQTNADAIADVIRMLEHLGAPQGSTFRLVDGGTTQVFGKAVGMEITIDAPKGTGPERIRRISRVCSEAVGDVAILQGTTTLPGRISLYFYGRDYKAMKNGLTARLRAHPLLQGARTRPLGP